MLDAPRAFSFAIGLCLTLITAILGVLWVRSGSRIDGVGVRVGGRTVEVFSDRGQVCFESVAAGDADPLSGLRNAARVKTRRGWAYSLTRTDPPVWTAYDRPGPEFG